MATPSFSIFGENKKPGLCYSTLRCFSLHKKFDLPLVAIEEESIQPTVVKVQDHVFRIE